MKHLPDPDRPGDLSPDDVRAHFSAYRAYLTSIRHLMPAAAFAFASAEWHYDATQHECPHDAWVEKMLVSERASGLRSEIRSIQMELTLLGAYHDGFLWIRYRDVGSYALSMEGSGRQNPAQRGHGDWLIDEVRLSEQGLILHEIALSNGGRWLIECADLATEWGAKVSRADGN